MARIGVAAVEDDAIYCAVPEAGPEGVGDIGEVKPYPRPADGYTSGFIGQRIREHFGAEVAAGRLAGLGVSMFGLLDCDSKALLDVPRTLSDWRWETEDGKRPAKPERDAALLDFKTLFPDLPLYLGHDASTMALGEWLKQPASPMKPELFVAIRIGTGVGVGCVNRIGAVRQGRSQVEAGHLQVTRREDDPQGTCQAHSRPAPDRWDCIEGLLSEDAILRRGRAQRLWDIPSNHVVWNTGADYLAQLCIAITALIAPDMIVIGGRTMIDGNGKFRGRVLKKIQDRFEWMIGDYPRYESTIEVKQYIRAARAVPNPASASLAGVTELARQKLCSVVEGNAVGFPQIS